MSVGNCRSSSKVRKVIIIHEEDSFLKVDWQPQRGDWQIRKCVGMNNWSRMQTE